MDCPNCYRPIPTDSKYCIYCSANLAAPETEVDTRPALGPTQRLDPSYNLPAPAAQVSAPAVVAAPAPKRSQRAKRKQPRVPLGAIWLIGLGILFLTELFWPGILVLIGVSSFVDKEAKGKRDEGLATLVFFSGLALLFLTELFWPGILVLAGVMWLLSRKGRGWSC